MLAKIKLLLMEAGEEVTVLRLLMAAVTGLAGIVGLFWKQKESADKEQKAKLTQAEQDRADLYKEREELWRQNAILAHDNQNQLKEIQSLRARLEKSND